FQAWCHTHEHVTSGVRRVRMLEVRSFCLYRRRTETAVLRSGPQFLSALPSTAKAVHLLRSRSGETAQRGCALETESGIAASPGTDSACDRSPVHHGNAARGTAETD